MQPFKLIELNEPTFFQKLFKKQPPENAYLELVNLLATNQIGSIAKTDIEKINVKYSVDVCKKHEEKISELLVQYIQFYFDFDANGLDFPNDGVDFLPILVEILAIDTNKAASIRTKVCSKVYKKFYEKIIVDRRLTEEKENLLEELQAKFDLPDNVVKPISEEVRGKTLQNYVNEMLADGEISPEEDDELEAAAASLSIEMIIDEQNKSSMDKMRHIWKINHEELPVIDVDIHLRKGEKCYLTQDVSWYETRVVKRNVSYGGTTGRIRIAKGLYYRYGDVNTSGRSVEELTKIDSGKIFITNKRLIFMGGKKNTSIQHSKILTINPFANGVDIIKDTGKSPFLKFSDNIDIFCAIFMKAVSNY